jgi:hypothetical protein
MGRLRCDFRDGMIVGSRSSMMGPKIEPDPAEEVPGGRLGKSKAIEFRCDDIKIVSA